MPSPVNLSVRLVLVLCFAAACLPTAVRPQVVSKAANNFTSASSNSTAATVDYEYDDYEDVDGRAREEGGVDGSVEQPYPPIPLQLWSPLRFGPVADEDADIPAGRSDIAGPLEASQLPLRPWGYTTVDRSMTPAQLPSSPLRGSASQRNNEAVTGSQFPALRPLRPQLPAQAPSTVQVAAGRQAPPSDVPMIPLLPEASASPSGEVLLPAVEDVDALMTSQASQEAAASIGRTIRLLVSSRIRDLTSLGVDSLPGARFLTTSRLSPRLAVLEIPEDGRRTLTERFSTQTVGDLIIEEDFEVQAMQQGMPDDPLYLDGSQWGLEKISAAALWRQGITGNSNVDVVVIDTGMDYEHPDLQKNAAKNEGEIPNNGIDDDGNGFVDDYHGLNAIDMNGDVMDESGHGTHVAGIIAATGNNARGGAGTAWTLALRPCKFLDGSGRGMISDAIVCMEWALSLGAKISCNSWGGGTRSQVFSDILDAARDRGHLFVAAAGNVASPSEVAESCPFYPAAYPHPNVLSVAATDEDDALARFSCYSSEGVDIAAPGVDIMSTYPRGGYVKLSGTSMACPFVAGVAALLLGAAEDGANIETGQASRIKEAIMGSADTVPDLRGKTVSGGRLNAERALARWRSLRRMSFETSSDTTTSYTTTSREANGRESYYGREGRRGGAVVQSFRPSSRSSSEGAYYGEEGRGDAVGQSFQPSRSRSSEEAYFDGEGGRGAAVVQSFRPSRTTSSSEEAYYGEQQGGRGRGAAVVQSFRPSRTTSSSEEATYGEQGGRGRGAVVQSFRSSRTTSSSEEAEIAESRPCAIIVPEGDHAVLHIDNGQFQLQLNIHNEHDRDLELAALVNAMAPYLCTV